MTDTERIQALVDAASEGDVVDLPAGVHEIRGISMPAGVTLRGCRIEGNTFSDAKE